MCFDQKIHGVSVLTTEILSVSAAFASEFTRPTLKKLKFWHSQNPNPSFTSNLMDVPARLRKAKIVPEKGSIFNMKRQLADSPSSRPSKING